MTIKKILIASVLLFGTSAAAIAGSGKAFVPTWSSTNVGKGTYIFLSNVTDNNLKVNIRAYDKSGNNLNSNYISYHDWSNSNTEINAHSSVTVVIDTNSSIPNTADNGYVVVEWENIGSDDDPFGLIGHGFRYSTTGDWSYAVPVNNGLPF